MPRYIDADELYKKIFPLDVVDKRRCSINAKAVAEAIVGMPTADVAPRVEWISVEERLPEQYGLFLIADDKGNMEVASWTKQFGWFSGGNRVKRVTHWMPLPEPPKGD